MEYITQSTYKDWVKYQTGSMCGLQFKSKYIDKTWKDTMNEKQQAGWWFEDMLVRGESEYEEARTKQGKITALYEHLRKHLPIADKLIKANGEIVSSNKDNIKGHIKGKADVVFSKKIVDIKTSAHVKNKFDFYGWGALVEEAGKVDKSHRYYTQLLDKLIQFKTYMFLFDNAECFEFWIFSSSDESRAFLRLNRSDYESEIESFGKLLENTYQEIIEHEFEPLPEYDRCRFCQLQGSCEYFESLPTPLILTR